jgi:hypothetical protein
MLFRLQSSGLWLRTVLLYRCRNTLHPFPWASTTLIPTYSTRRWQSSEDHKLNAHRQYNQEISNTIILFINRTSPMLIRLRAGSSIRGVGGTVHPASEVITHPEYWNADYDIAVIKVRLSDTKFDSASLNPKGHSDAHEDSVLDRTVVRHRRESISCLSVSRYSIY